MTEVLEPAGGHLVAETAVVREQEHHRLHFLSQVALRSALVLAPLAGAATAVEYGPPAHVQIAGVDVNLKLKLGEDSNSASMFGGAASIRMPSQAHIGPKAIGVSADLNVRHVSLIDSHGRFDPQKFSDYAAMFTDYKPIVEQITQSAKEQALVSASLGLEAVTALELGGIAYLRCRRRTLDTYNAADRALITEYQREPRRTAWIGGTALGVALLSVGGQLIVGPNHHQSLVPDHLLQGTGLDAAELDGPLTPVMQKTIPLVIRFIETTDAFYTNAADQLHSSFQAYYNQPKLPKEKDVVRMLVADDFQGKTGMERLSGIAAKLWNVDTIVVSGDTSFSGSAYETPTISSLSYHAGKNIKIVAAMGIHDSTETHDLAKKAHWTVSTGDVQQVNGVSYLVIDDPRHVAIGGRIYNTRPETLEEFTNTQIEQVCKTKPDFVVIHDRDLGRKIAQTGCAGAVLDGRSYEPLAPQTYAVPLIGTSRELTSGSAGAYKTNDGFNLGAIDNTASLRAVSFNTKSHELSYQNISITSSGETIISSPVSLGPITTSGKAASRLQSPHQPPAARRK